MERGSWPQAIQKPSTVEDKVYEASLPADIVMVSCHLFAQQVKAEPSLPRQENEVTQEEFE